MLKNIRDKNYPIFFSTFSLFFLITYSVIGSRYIDAGNDYQADFILQNDLYITFLFLAGSFIETLIFNFLIISLLKKQKFVSINDGVIILLSSIIFGLGHFSSFTFFIISTIAGCVFNTNYIVYLNRYKNNVFPFISTFLLHFLSNFTTFIVIEKILN